MHKNTAKGLWKYLDELGVLEKGSDEEIKASKKRYWKKYFFEYKQRQRQKKPEYNVYYSKETGEYNRIIQAAKKHNLTPTAFIRQSSLAYIDRKYVVPNQEQVMLIKQLLSDCLDEVKAIAGEHERFFWKREQKLNVIEKRIEKLEAQINEVLVNPPLLNQ